MACVRIKYPLKYPLCPSKFPLKLNAHSDSTDQAPLNYRPSSRDNSFNERILYDDE